jgi:diguanylate cyclase (GGDEF)-like protein/PAS domain S-box-containing protein
VNKSLRNRTRRDDQHPLAQIDDRFREIFDAVNDGILISDPATRRFIEVNEAGRLMLGYEAGELIGADIESISGGVHDDIQDEIIQKIKTARLGNSQTFEWQCKTKGGALFWSDVSIRYAEIGRIPVIVATVRDISERKRLDAEIVYAAHYDALTGLGNRLTFAMAIDREILQSHRSGGKFAVISLDLDHFKDINGTRGHLVGDRILSMVADRLRASVRLNESVARFGGDEFAVLLCDMDDPADVAALATRLISSLSEPFSVGGMNSHISASIGVAVYGEDARDAETLLAHADIALNRAKSEGRQTYRFYSRAMNEAVRSRVALTDELRFAILHDELFLVYQPQVRLKTGRIIGVEALVRWHHPTRGILNPGAFLPVAESSGLMAVLGQWVLREACRQGRRWLDAGIGPGTIAVNLSSAQFKDPLELESAVLAVLAETKLPARLLELEITETTLINLSPLHGEVIQRLRRAGVRFSLDDFGTGYSALSYLRRIQIDRIKIAHEFIAEIATCAGTASIIKLILGLSRDFGSEVIAEGVETSEQLRLLEDLDCTDVQGFFFAHPMTADALVPMLNAGTISGQSVFAAPAAQIASAVA